MRRLELRAGKFGMADFFDLNDSGSDSHSQFMNWTVDNNGAYDYAADTRGYTVGAKPNTRPELGLAIRRRVDAQSGERPHLDRNLRRSRAENVELKFVLTLVWGSCHNVAPVVVRESLQHGPIPARPSMTSWRAKRRVRKSRAHALQTTVKYGFGV